MPVVPGGLDSAEDIDLAALRGEVRTRLGELEEDFWTDDTITDRLNEAQKRFANEERWRWLTSKATGLSLPAGTPTLAMQPEVNPNRQFDIRLTRTGRPDPLLPKRVDAVTGFQLESMYYTRDEPQWYYLSLAQQNGSGDVAYTVTFVPVPLYTYTVDYLFHRRPATMVDDSDSPDIPEDYVAAITAWATGLCWLDELNGGGKAQEQFNLYNAVLQQARDDQSKSAVDSPIAWGGQEPNYAGGSILDPRRRMSPTLGP